MKDSVAVGIITVAILLGTAGIVKVVTENRPKPAVIEVTPRALLGDPDFYNGRKVRMSSEGFEQTAPDTLVFRRRAGTEPSVVCTFTKPVPEPRPKFFTGHVTSTPGGVVTLTNCVAD